MDALFCCMVEYWQYLAEWMNDVFTEKTVWILVTFYVPGLFYTLMTYFSYFFLHKNVANSPIALWLCSCNNTQFKPAHLRMAYTYLSCWFDLYRWWDYLVGLEMGVKCWMLSPHCGVRRGDAAFSGPMLWCWNRLSIPLRFSVTSLPLFCRALKPWESPNL